MSRSRLIELFVVLVPSAISLPKLPGGRERQCWLRRGSGGADASVNVVGIDNHCDTDYKVDRGKQDFQGQENVAEESDWYEKIQGESRRRTESGISGGGTIAPAVSRDISLRASLGTWRSTKFVVESQSGHA